MADRAKTKAQLCDEISALQRRLADLEARDIEHRQIAAKYQTLIEQLPAITYTVSLNEVNRTSYISPQVEELLGFSPEEWLAEPDLWAKLIHPEDQERVLAEVEYRDASGEPFDLEYRTFARDGSIHWLHNRYMLVRGDQTHYLHGVMFDVTERKLAEQQLLRQNKYLAALHEMALNLNSQFDLNGLLKTLIMQAGQLLQTVHGFICLSEASETEPNLKVGAGLFAAQAPDQLWVGADFVKAVWQSDQPMVVADYKAWPERDPAISTTTFRTILGIPFAQNVGGGKGDLSLKGVWGMAYEQQRPVSQEEIELLQRFAELATVAINNAWLLEETTKAQRQAEDRAKELATLNRINQTVSNAQNLPAALAVVARELVEIFKARNSGITLLNAARTEMTVVADHSLDPAEPSTVGIVIPVVGNPSSSRVIETGQSLVIRHAQTDPLTQSIHPILKARNTHCLLITPLLAQGEVLGTIGLDSTDPDRFFSPEEVRLAETIAGQIAGIVDKTRLLNQAQEQRQIAESLRQVAAVLNASLEIDIVLNNILQQLGQVVQYDSATILLHAGDALVIINGVNLPESENPTGQTIPLSSNSPGVRVFRQRQPLIIADVQTDPSWFNLPGAKHIHGWMGIPLLAGEKAIGVLAVDNLTVGAYGATEAQVVQTFANQAALAIVNAQLYQRVTERTEELSQTLEELKAAQTQLVEAEKMASLGSLVAGVAHEINTPIGVGVTAASTLDYETSKLLEVYRHGSLKRSALDTYLTIARESSQLILNNLGRAAELVQSFKQVAVDQTNLEKRKFAVKAYINEVLRSLAPQLKRVAHQVSVRGDETLEIDSYPGALSQVVTNLVMNSLHHGYPDGKSGHLSFELKGDPHKLIIEYGDDGCGISPEHLGQIFQPFFTTARQHGGTGLGLHIVYNLVTQKLGGTIVCESEVGCGARFILALPLKADR